MLTAYFFARKSQEADSLRQEEARLRQEAENARGDAEVQVQILKAQLEQATTPRRRNRRRLRNGPSRRER